MGLIVLIWISSGLMCELLWSDPQPNPGRGPSKRGVGLSFGGDVTKRFLQENNLGKLVSSDIFFRSLLMFSSQ